MRVSREGPNNESAREDTLHSWIATLVSTVEFSSSVGRLPASPNRLRVRRFGVPGGSTGGIGCEEDWLIKVRDSNETAPDISGKGRVPPVIDTADRFGKAERGGRAPPRREPDITSFSSFFKLVSAGEKVTPPILIESNVRERSSLRL